jgi:hypothetical protein
MPGGILSVASGPVLYLLIREFASIPLDAIKFATPFGFFAQLFHQPFSFMGTFGFHRFIIHQILLPEMSPKENIHQSAQGR